MILVGASTCMGVDQSQAASGGGANIWLWVSPLMSGSQQWPIRGAACFSTHFLKSKREGICEVWAEEEHLTCGSFEGSSHQIQNQEPLFQKFFFLPDEIGNNIQPISETFRLTKGNSPRRMFWVVMPKKAAPWNCFWPESAVLKG